MGSYNIAVLPGDGIGPEVADEGLKVLEAVSARFGHEFNYTKDLVGGCAIDLHGTALRPETVSMCKGQDAIYFGSVGGPKWDDPSAEVRPEQAILGLREELGLFANIRPVKMFSFLSESTTLKSDVVKQVDMIILRELTGGAYYGKPKKRWSTSRGRYAVDSMKYSEREIERIVRVGFQIASGRKKVLHSADKANVLESSRLWREIANEVADDFPDVELIHILADACAMHLIRRPTDFDVIVTENLFGDMLSDEASMLAGSMGMLPSASLGKRRSDGTGLGMYEPIHGTAPDIAGEGVANPVAMILSGAMLLRHSLGLDREADVIEDAVREVLEAGHRPADVAVAGEPFVGTSDLGTLIADAVA